MSLTSTSQDVRLTDKGAEAFELLLLAYVNGYTSRSFILSQLDMLLQSEYIKGETNGIKLSTERMKEILK